MKNEANDAFSRLLRTRLARAGTSFFFSKPTPAQASNPYNPDLEEVGFQFEKFVLRRFRDDYFTLLEWRSAKQLDGRFPKSCQLPDLEFYFQTDYDSFHFAVECKWRANFQFGSVCWAKDSQLLRYKEYQDETKIPVFIVLGVGGESNKPNVVYCFRPDEVDNSTLHKITLDPFRRKNPGDNFFINPTANKLT
jgi:hypothetical protein